ncbi:TonB-dependent hemoglobin/transferrin/lactoferrin family receptor [Hyphomicrobium sp.]|uniref:TonB-dependent hemoglobin/transferrin/lactoferrin family receptor n=1 Tax=Hyphomicrobium sp. TaxID=82 RepID=UPI002BDE7477|nr:TonB-dependent hemoglobin/transferrin/lactoferrin family receptor [Hyphomicrobium sp.]HRN87268.1 TonB-dependent hemoglobin/transferrin/lactoferrin family receptor [Hyphomicrobium sp.]HRQ25974.1 TonB-dependent hemoglobin/transferrin/lactoferrin family receptor [Hyphomicrobium sp.]
MSKRASSRLLMAAALLGVAGGHASSDEIQLDGIVVTSTKTEESWIDALSGSSAVDRATMDEQFNADRVSEILRTIPGVTTQETARDTATAVNIRGLQDFGRVNVLVDGARQNFQRSGHSANGVFYIEPEMIKRVDITRGPTATIYGSGAIGGVAAFETLDADDILRPGEYAAVRGRASYGTNGDEKLGSGTTAVKVGNFDILGQFNARRNGDYEDGSGNKVPGSNDETDSKLVKFRVRPAEGHQITASLIDYNSAFIDEVESGGTQYDTGVDNRQYTLGYTFQSPTNPLIDFSGKIYRNETGLDQTRLTGGNATFFSPTPLAGSVPCTPASLAANGFNGFLPVGAPCFVSPGTFPVGAQRGFNTETEGFDVFNTSRFPLATGVDVALTYGLDGFRDTVNTVDPSGSGDEFTPSGERNIWGSFVQSKVTFFDVVDVIGALRYDSYELDGNGVNVQDEHVSPKITVGVTPVQGVTVFGTWAEGFRAPALSETLITGFHPGFANFELRPNPDLKPEVAQNVEGGVNFKFDNVLTTGDRFRAKVTAFRNEVEDYIDMVSVEGPTAGYLLFQRPGCTAPAGPPVSCFPTSFLPIFMDDYIQYRNISNATLEGIEFEALYDAGAWFAGLGAHHIRGKNEDTGEGLRTVPADQVTVTAGFRAFDDKLVAGGRVRFVAAQDRFIEGDNPAMKHTDSYNVVDLFAQYEATDNVTLNVNIDNLFDQTYRQHLDQYNSPGFSARAGLTMRFGASN